MERELANTSKMATKTEVVVVACTNSSYININIESGPNVYIPEMNQIQSAHHILTYANFIRIPHTRWWLQSFINTKIDESMPLKICMYSHHKRPVTCKRQTFGCITLLQ